MTPESSPGPDPADRTPGTVSWRELLTETEALLTDRRHARWICERASSTEPDEFRTMLDDPATERAVRHLDQMVSRARTGEPIQYVLGSWPFRRLELAVDRRVLIPRPETEELAGLAIDFARGVEAPRVVVDLGTGSGAIGLALADELPLVGTEVWLTDASDDALDVARANLAGLGRAARNVTVARGSWFEALPSGLRADLIVANPPYVAVGDADLDPAVADWEPSTALLSGADGLDDLRVIAGGASDRLRPGGRVLVEHGHRQGEAVRSLFRDGGLVGVSTRTDGAGLDRITLGAAPS